jgi:hypothetical protein
MLKTNPKGKYDEYVMNENNEKKLNRQSIRTPMGEPVIELFGETAFENTLDMDPGKHKVHEKNTHDKDPGKDKVPKKPEKRDVLVNINPEGKHDEDVNVGNMKKRDAVVDIIDAVMLNMFEKPKPRDGMLKTNPKGKNNDNVNVNNVMDVNNAAAPIEDPKLYHDNYYQYSTSNNK